MVKKNKIKEKINKIIEIILFIFVCGCFGYSVWKLLGR